jgi:CDP-diacylglycerol--glycerol-3-phosphate 3-phosphatidyltransferase
MQRPERVVTIGLCALLSGIVAQYIGGNYKLFVPGIKFHIFEPISIFTFPLVLLAVLTNITAFNRLREAKKALIKQEEEDKA